MTSAAERVSPRVPALGGDWYPRALPDSCSISPRLVFAADGGVSRGLLYRVPGARTVVTVMHPRADATRHYAIPALLGAGFDVWAQVGRTGGTDLQLVHELALLDIGAGLCMLRDEGYRHIVPLGNSGGASLYTFYVEQAARPGPERIARTPGGRPCPLPQAELPLPDAMVYLAPHPGQGALLMECIDPSVTDEHDPLSVDPALDLFDPANGFVPGPASSSYRSEFLATYRAAQRRRVERIDALARAALERRRAARVRFKDAGAVADQRRSVQMPVVTVHRTDADPRTVDLSLDPSDRRYGSVFGRHPDVTNYGLVGFGRMTTPEAWLSTWSGLSSNASMARNAGAVTQPALVVQYTGDTCVFPSQTRAIVAALGSADVTHVEVRADHFGNSIDGEEPPEDALPVICDWLRARFT